eukprot:UN05670
MIHLKFTSRYRRKIIERIRIEKDEERKKCLYEAQVHILERMGNPQTALEVIVKHIQDVEKAIDFVERSKDTKLWDQLISWSLHSSGQLP